MLIRRTKQSCRAVEFYFCVWLSNVIFLSENESANCDISHSHLQFDCYRKCLRIPGMTLWIHVYIRLVHFQGQNQSNDSVGQVPPLQNRPLAANQQDLSDGLNDVLLDGLLASGTVEQRQLVADMSVATAMPECRDVLLRVIQYNLDAIQNIALTRTRCALAPLQQSRLAIEGARDRALLCLGTWRQNQQSDAYTQCLQRIFPEAQREIDSLKPSIDACLQAVAMDTASNVTNGQQTTNANWTRVLGFRRKKWFFFRFSFVRIKRLNDLKNAIITFFNVRKIQWFESVKMNAMSNNEWTKSYFVWWWWRKSPKCRQA